MSNVAVSGLPPNITCSTIAQCFSKILAKIGVRKFWVRALSYENGSKQATIEFVSPFEALNATNRLNNLLLDFDGRQFQLEANVEAKRRPQSPSNHRRRSPNLSRGWYKNAKYPQLFYQDERGPNMQYAERDCSPIQYHNEASKLDMEIELLRKQRLVIEEERRLLMATKKMELVREFGPSAAKELAYISQRESVYETDARQPRRAEKRAFRPPPYPRQVIKRPHFTPLFVLPCKKLMQSMRERMTIGITDYEARSLWGQIRSTLRKRIAVALEGKPRMASVDIVKLYRNLYPEKTDDDLVKRLLKKLRGESDLKEMKEETDGAVEEDALSEPSTSTADLKPEPPSTPNAQDLEDPNTECALSLDATEIESLNEESEWKEGNGDWWCDDANQAFVE